VDRYGIANSSYSFNGINSHIDISDSLELRLDSTDYSISVWVLFNGFSNQDLISKKGSGPQNGYTLKNNNTSIGVNKVAMLFSQLGTDSIAYSGLLTPAAWRHVMVTYNYTSKTLKFFIDGVFSDSALNMPSPSPTCNSNMRFGGDISTDSHWHNGKLDDIGMWNRELTPAEILTVYNATTGINEYSNNTAFGCYPNPNNGVFTITTSQKNKNRIQVYDVLGKIVKQSEMNNDTYTMDISDQPSGIYFVKIQTDKESITRKIVKE